MVDGEGVFGVKVRLLLRHSRRGKEGTAQKSGFQLHHARD
jgi:hypothetical protein